MSCHISASRNFPTPATQATRKKTAKREEIDRHGRREDATHSLPPSLLQLVRIAASKLTRCTQNFLCTHMHQKSQQNGIPFYGGKIRQQRARLQLPEPLHHSRNRSTRFYCVGISQCSAAHLTKPLQKLHSPQCVTFGCVASETRRASGVPLETSFAMMIIRKSRLSSL